MFLEILYNFWNSERETLHNCKVFTALKHRFGYLLCFLSPFTKTSENGNFFRLLISLKNIYDP